MDYILYIMKTIKEQFFKNYNFDFEKSQKENETDIINIKLINIYYNSVLKTYRHIFFIDFMQHFASVFYDSNNTLPYGN